MAELLARPLAHAIRYALDVALPFDVLVLEAQRDAVGESMLSALRARTDELGPSDWARLRGEMPHVWRVLVDVRRATHA